MEKHDAPTASVYPRAINHIGVGVADIRRAVQWYQEVLGFTLLMEPTEVRAEPGTNARDVLGETFNAMLQAHMVSVNGIGLELFQLLDPPHERREPSLEYWKSGFFHICVTLPVGGNVPRYGGITQRRIGIGSVIARILLEISSKSTPITTRRYTEE
jgi:Glyoxalase/Bleomycin resistance protein/Dioxygenase superfamily